MVLVRDDKRSSTSTASLSTSTNGEVCMIFREATPPQTSRGRCFHREWKGLRSSFEKLSMEHSEATPGWASKFLREWCTRASRSRVEPMQKIAKMLRQHEQLLLNWFESQGLSSGIVEGFNNKAKLIMRKAYGLKDSETLTTALYHQLGNLPEPKRTHGFRG